MRSRKFKIVGIDALEERRVPSAFGSPFTPLTRPAGEVDPKSLNLTGRTQQEVGSAIRSSFRRFEVAGDAALADLRDGTFPAPESLYVRVGEALDRLTADLRAASAKIPYGRLNLFPVLRDRIASTSGVADTSTGVATPSLRTRLIDRFTTGSTNRAGSEIHATRAMVMGDVDDYLRLGVTNGFFRLTRGARLPAPPR